eukprot:2014545-Prymnesium_polylepis.1
MDVGMDTDTGRMLMCMMLMCVHIHVGACEGRGGERWGAVDCGGERLSCVFRSKGPRGAVPAARRRR